MNPYLFFKRILRFLSRSNKNERPVNKAYDATAPEFVVENISVDINAHFPTYILEGKCPHCGEETHCQSPSTLLLKFNFTCAHCLNDISHTPNWDKEENPQLFEKIFEMENRLRESFSQNIHDPSFTLGGTYIQSLNFVAANQFLKP